MDCGHQDTGCDPDRLRHVVVLDAPSVRVEMVGLAEDHDEIWGGLQIGLVVVGAKWRKGVEPVTRRAARVECPFLFLGRGADTALDRQIGHDHEMPRLHVRPARGACRRVQTPVDHLSRDGPGGELSDGPAPAHVGGKPLCTPGHFLLWIGSEAFQRDEPRRLHAASPH